MMISSYILIVCCYLLLSLVSSYSFALGNARIKAFTRIKMNMSNNNINNNNSPKSIANLSSKSKSISFIKSILYGSSALLLHQAIIQPRKAIADTSNEITNTIAPTELKGFQTKTGLKYFDFKIGTPNTSPRYGQLVSFYYTTYYRPNPGTADSTGTALETIDSNVPYKEPFLHKHGNPRVIRGIDEAIHTMGIGGKRRIIVPKSIGYTEIGLGPVPQVYLK